MNDVLILLIHFFLMCYMLTIISYQNKPRKRNRQLSDGWELKEASENE